MITQCRLEILINLRLFLPTAPVATGYNNVLIGKVWVYLWVRGGKCLFPNCGLTILSNYSARFGTKDAVRQNTVSYSFYSWLIESNSQQKKRTIRDVTSQCAHRHRQNSRRASEETQKGVKNR